MKKKLHQFLCSSMMLPEHREKLHKHRKEEAMKEKYPFPLLDEQQQEVFCLLLNGSFREGITIKITVFNKGEYRTLTGRVAGYDPVRKSIKIITAAGAEELELKLLINVEN